MAWWVVEVVCVGWKMGGGGVRWSGAPCHSLTAGRHICSDRSKLRWSTCRCSSELSSPNVFLAVLSLLQAVVSWNPVAGQSGKYEMITQLDVIPVVTIFDKM